MAARKPPDILLAKMENIDAYIQELEPLVHIPLAEFLEHPYYRRAAERLIQIIIEGAIDCGAIVLDQMGKLVPAASREIFARLHQFGVPERSLAQRFQDYAVGSSMTMSGLDAAGLPHRAAAASGRPRLFKGIAAMGSARGASAGIRLEEACLSKPCP